MLAIINELGLFRLSVRGSVCIGCEGYLGDLLGEVGNVAFFAVFHLFSGFF